MSDSPYTHIGVIVADIDEAIVDFARIGIGFMTPRVVHVDRLVEADGESEIDLKIAFSLQGPPFLELIEAVGNGIYGQAHIGELHHVAILDDDPATRQRLLLADGSYRSTAAQYRDDGSMIVTYLESKRLHGLRVELLHTPVAAAILAWVRGENATP